MAYKEQYPPAANLNDIGDIEGILSPTRQQESSAQNIANGSSNKAPVWSDETTPELFGRNPKPSEVIQGQCWSCWLLAALCLVITVPDLLKRMKVAKKVKDVYTCTYTFELYKYGKPATITVDNNLQEDFKGNLVNAKSRSGLPGVPLIEKAVAEMYGGYSEIGCGQLWEGFATLTGLPCEIIPFQNSEQDHDDVWKKVLGLKKDGCLIGASCETKSGINGKDISKQGLEAPHAYAVLKITEEKLDDGGVVKLIQLYDPRGSSSWEGGWSNKSPQWEQNPALAKRLLSSQSQQGIFWMNYKDFKERFASLVVCKIHEKDWFMENRAGRFPKGVNQTLSGFYFSLREKSPFDISLFQQVTRTSAGTDILDGCICVYESSRSESNAKCVLGRLVACTKLQACRYLSLGRNLKPGNYVVVCMAFKDWSSELVGRTFDDRTLQYVLTLHSKKSFTLAGPQEIDCLLADAVTKLVLKEGEKIREEEDIRLYLLEGRIMVVENLCPDRAIGLYLDYNKSSNVVSTRGDLKTWDLIPPSHRQVLMVLSVWNVKERGDIDGQWAITPPECPQYIRRDHQHHPTSSSNHCPVLGANVEGLHLSRPL